MFNLQNPFLLPFSAAMFNALRIKPFFFRQIQQVRPETSSSLFSAVFRFRFMQSDQGELSTLNSALLMPDSKHWIQVYKLNSSTQKKEVFRSEIWIPESMDFDFTD